MTEEAEAEATPEPHDLLSTLEDGGITQDN